MKIKPLFDRVVLRPLEIEDTYKSGIVFAENVGEKPSFGTVIAVGNGTGPDGLNNPLQVVVGDEVLYSKFAGVEYKVGGETLVIMRQTDILAVVKKEVL